MRPMNTKFAVKELTPEDYSYVLAEYKDADNMTDEPNVQVCNS